MNLGAWISGEQKGVEGSLPWEPLLSVPLPRSPGQTLPARHIAIEMQNAQRTPKDKSPAQFGRRQASLCTGDCCWSEAGKANGSGLLILMVTSLSASPTDFPSVFQPCKSGCVWVTFMSDGKWKMLKEITASVDFILFYSLLFMTPHI